jgi:hypothetical protein
MITRIISGGQTGADQAGLRAARAAGIQTGGWAPRGWLTEDDPAPSLADYGLVECRRRGHPARTRRNVMEADAVLWFGNPHSRGGKLTLGLCAERAVDSYVVLDRSTPQDVAAWLRHYIFPVNEQGAVVMVAGNRASGSPGIGARAEAFLAELFGLLRAAGGQQR